MNKLNKKEWLHLEDIESLMNKTILNGDFQFDSYEKEDDSKTCYVTEKFGNGMCYMINSDVAEKSKMAPQPKYK